ncbi:heme exporter protein CcmD [Paracoccus salipaludis]|nr:heme exporter protein CcmD [Paracoccus salipaludis]
MIAELGRHAAPVLAAWSISGVLIVGLIAQTLVAASRARRALEKVERRG